MRTSALHLAILREAGRLKDPIAGLLSLRSHLPKGSYSELIRVAGDKAIKAKLQQAAFPHSGGPARPSYYFDSVGMENELRWARLYLSLYSDELTRYVRLRNTFEKAVLLGDGTGAINALTEIEVDLGESTWAVRQKVTALQVFQGMDAQKQYAKGIRDLAPYGLTGLVALFASHRAESAVSLDRFSSQFRASLDSYELPTELRLYLEEQLIPVLNPEENRLLSLLNVEVARSAIDYYEAIIRTCIYVAGQVRAGEAEPAVVREAIDLVERLEKTTGDVRAGRLLFEFRATLGEEGGNVGTEPIEPFELMIRGEYGAAVTVAISELAADPTSYGSIEVAARARAAGAPAPEGNGTIIHEVIQGLSAVYAQGADSEAAALGLMKTATIFMDFGWGRALAGSVLHEGPPQVVHESQPPSPTQESHASILMLSRIHPLYLSRAQTTSVRERYASVLDAEVPGSLSGAYARTLAGERHMDGLALMDEGEKDLLLTAGSYVNRNFPDTLSGAERLLSSGDARFKRAAYRFKAWALLLSGEITECVSLVVSVLSEHSDRWGAFPLEGVAVVAARTDEGRPLERAILFDLHTRHISDAYQLEGVWALEDLLDELGVSRPSELSLEQIPSRSSLVYLLRSVCRESALAHLPSLTDSTSAVEEERVTILRLLAELDPAGAATYGNEQAGLIQQMTYQRQKQEIDRSKVYIDVEGVRKEVQNLRDSYDRYLGFVNNDFIRPILDIDLGDEEGGVPIIVFADGTTLSDQYQVKAERGEVVVVKLPRNELDSLLAYIVQSIRDEYVSNSKHGLNGYLSMRVRHGTLLGEMRSPVERHNLITQVDSETGDYQRNAHWLDRVTDTWVDRDRLSDALTHFSQKYDAFIEGVKTDWIQVKRLTDEPGLFDFTITFQEVRQLQEELWNHPPTFEDFVSHVFALLEGKLDRSLEAVRVALESEAKAEAASLLRKLQIEVEQVGSPLAMADLLNEITATRTATLDTITKITRWFDSPGEEAVGTFRLEDAVRLAEQSVLVSAPGLSVSYAGPQDVGIRGSFPSCFDIFYNMFDNAAKRSGFDGDVSVAVEVEASAEGLTVRITNPVAEISATDEARERVEESRRTVEKNRYGSRVAEEGGTGLQKIANALLRDFSPGEDEKPSLEFEFLPGPSFAVRIRFPHLIVEETLIPANSAS